ncbi:MAG: ACP S-malonyltransferase [Bacteroidales bacterium]|nr:ACP S-malonyltransferase [Bacteroidales bacterium]MBR1575610.1 ACP S-malonyltransferase [Bacteroidales bacterium]
MAKAFLFPGQGSQFPGMAKDLYDSCPEAKALMDRADEVLGFPLTEVMFHGSDEDLRATRVTQPAVFVHSLAAFAARPERQMDMAAGHSLGEFSALTAAGVLDFDDALRLVALRATEMQKCCEQVPGTMAAIIGLDEESVERICAGTDGTVVPANYNSDIQVVISGESEAVLAACEKAKEAGARRALPLPVGGAFHSPLMEPARAVLAEAIAATRFHKSPCPVYQNVTALPETDPDRIQANLLAQLTAPVRWTCTIRRMSADGAVEWTELGPGSVLSGLLKRIHLA